ncbi:MAG: class I SAM-dependent methyltransferase [Phycisphaerae bacterium]|jgi:SAM-dependent methyltransferase|nr:class I SAM-dependent methyltransferase [Phycisphaerae bacterium]
MTKSQRIRHHYQPRIDDARENYDVVDWASAAAQQVRFAVLVDNVPLDGRTLLDVGCGLGDLRAYIEGRGISVDYRGVDLLAEMTASAARQNPEGRFICGDIFDPVAGVVGAEMRFDVVFCSGMLNLDLGNNAEFLPEALRRMLELSGEYMVVNLLHARSEMRYPHCAYYDPDAVMKILEPMPCTVRLIDDYLPNDFTLICSVGGGD